MAQKLYSWETSFDFKTYKKNIIEDDIILDENIKNLENFIKSYCNANYNNYASSGNSSYDIETVEGEGVHDCNGCDTSANCFKASVKDGPDYSGSCANPNHPGAGGGELVP